MVNEELCRTHTDYNLGVIQHDAFRWEGEHENATAHIQGTSANSVSDIFMQDHENLSV